MFVNKEMSSVKDTKTPSAAVPPKLEAEKIEKPQNKMMDVYTMLKPVSLMADEMASEADFLYFFNS